VLYLLLGLSCGWYFGQFLQTSVNLNFEVKMLT
jgi:hypothetical protein